MIIAGLLAGCSAAAPASEPSPMTTPATAPSSSSTPAPTMSPAPVARAEGLAPTAVSIPAIGVTRTLIDLGIADDGGMEVPADFDDVGWFTGGGKPGGRGPLVIAGHVDSPTGPAVFVRLHEIAIGDAVEVTDSAGTIHRYVVTEVADYAKSAFPTARVFGAVAGDELRLITCGGVFDRSVGSYEDNRVVYAVRSGS